MNIAIKDQRTLRRELRNLWESGAVEFDDAAAMVGIDVVLSRTAFEHFADVWSDWTRHFEEGKAIY